MSTHLQELNEQLKRAWCDSFDVAELADGALTISTPFLFGDGDSFPVIVESDRDGWLLTDRGVAISHLQFDAFELTDGRLRHIEHLAAMHGSSLVDRALVLRLDEAPGAEEIADFLKLVAQVSALPLQPGPDRDTDQFRTRARAKITEWMPPRLRTTAQPNWAPPRPRGDLFEADIWLPAATPVVAFFAGSTSKADRSMAVVSHYQHWNLDVMPLLAFTANLSSDTIFRAQEILGDESAVIRINEALDVTGYQPLRRRLADAGVNVSHNP